jgi:signal recognition particle subunit SRP54
MLKMHRQMADVMKMMGSGRRGPMAGIANMLGLGGGMPTPTPEQMAEMAKKMPGGAGGGLPPSLPGLPPKFPGTGPLLPGLGGAKPGLGGFPGLGKKK